MILSILNNKIAKFQALYRGYSTRKKLQQSILYFQHKCCIPIEATIQKKNSPFYSYSYPVSSRNFSLLDQYDSQSLFIHPDSKNIRFMSEISSLNSQVINPSSRESLPVLLQEEVWLQKAIYKRIKVTYIFNFLVCLFVCF